MEAKTINDNNSVEPKNHDFTICVIQLTRIGDILQTYQAAQIYKMQNPETKLMLVAREKFAKPILFLLKNVFDHIELIDPDKFTSNTKNIEEAQDNLRTFVAKLNEKAISRVVNLSFCKTSSYLTSLLSAPEVRGLRIDTRLKTVIKDPWSRYLYSNVMGGVFCPFSLVDIFSEIIGADTRSIDKTKEFSIGSFEKREGLIVIHPFASREKKYWPAHKWTEVIFKLLKNNPKHKVYVVGSKDELKQANKIVNSAILKNYKDRLISNVGTTSIEDLYKLLTRSQFFIGHDSMVGHLAAITKTLNITVSLGTVRPHETSPYIQGGINIMPRTPCFPCYPNDECANFKCHSDISYQAIPAIVDLLLTTGVIEHKTLEEKISFYHINSLNLLQTVFMPSGFMTPYFVTNNHLGTNDVYRSFYRILWLFTLADSEEKTPIPEITDTIYRCLYSDIAGLRNLYEVCEFYKRYSKYIIQEVSSDTPNLSNIKEFSKKLDELDLLFQKVKDVYPRLAPLIDYYSVYKANIDGQNIVELSQNTYLTHHEFASNLSVLYEFIESSLRDYKIKNNLEDDPKEINRRG